MEACGCLDSVGAEDHLVFGPWIRATRVPVVPNPNPQNSKPTTAAKEGWSIPKKIAKRSPPRDQELVQYVASPISSKFARLMSIHSEELVTISLWRMSSL